MFDANLMLLDAATITANGAEQTGAWLDLWSVSADFAPQLSAYEVADPPGQGGAVRAMVWNLYVGLSAAISDALAVNLDWSDDGAAENGLASAFPTVAAADPLVARVDRIAVVAPSRYVRYTIALLGGVSTTVLTLGPTLGGEYTNPGT